MPEARAISPAAIPVKEASHFPMAAACNRHGVVKRIHEGPANQMKTAEIQSASGYPMKINDVSLLHLIYTEPHAQNTVKRSIAIVRHCQAAHAAGYPPLGGNPASSGSRIFLFPFQSHSPVSGGEDGNPVPSACRFKASFNRYGIELSETLWEICATLKGNSMTRILCPDFNNTATHVFAPNTPACLNNPSTGLFSASAWSGHGPRNTTFSTDDCAVFSEWLPETGKTPF